MNATHLTTAELHKVSSMPNAGRDTGSSARGGPRRPTRPASGFRIWGTTDVLNDPTRKRTASEDDARRMRIAREIEASVRAKCPMRNIKGDHPLYELEDE